MATTILRMIFFKSIVTLLLTLSLCSNTYYTAAFSDHKLAKETMFDLSRVLGISEDKSTLGAFILAVVNLKLDIEELGQINQASLKRVIDRTINSLKKSNVTVIFPPSRQNTPVKQLSGIIEDTISIPLLHFKIGETHRIVAFNVAKLSPIALKELGVLTPEELQSCRDNGYLIINPKRTLGSTRTHRKTLQLFQALINAGMNNAGAAEVQMLLAGSRNDQDFQLLWQNRPEYIMDLVPEDQSLVDFISRVNDESAPLTSTVLTSGDSKDFVEKHLRETDRPLIVIQNAWGDDIRYPPFGGGYFYREQKQEPKTVFLVANDFSELESAAPRLPAKVLGARIIVLNLLIYHDGTISNPAQSKLRILTQLAAARKADMAFINNFTGLQNQSTSKFIALAQEFSGGRMRCLAADGRLLSEAPATAAAASTAADDYFVISTADGSLTVASAVAPPDTAMAKFGASKLPGQHYTQCDCAELFAKAELDLIRNGDEDADEAALTFSVGEHTPARSTGEPWTIAAFRGQFNLIMTYLDSINEPLSPNFIANGMKQADILKIIPIINGTHLDITVYFAYERSMRDKYGCVHDGVWKREANGKVTVILNGARFFDADDNPESVKDNLVAQQIVIHDAFEAITDDAAVSANLHPTAHEMELRLESTAAGCAFNPNIPSKRALSAQNRQIREARLVSQSKTHSQIKDTIMKNTLIYLRKAIRTTHNGDQRREFQCQAYLGYLTLRVDERINHLYLAWDLCVVGDCPPERIIDYLEKAKASLLRQSYPDYQKNVPLQESLNRSINAIKAVMLALIRTPRTEDTTKEYQCDLLLRYLSIIAERGEEIDYNALARDVCIQGECNQTIVRAHLERTLRDLAAGLKVTDTLAERAHYTTVQYMLYAVEGLYGIDSIGRVITEYLKVDDPDLEQLFSPALASV